MRKTASFYLTAILTFTTATSLIGIPSHTAKAEPIANNPAVKLFKDPTTRIEILSKTYVIDKKLRSMEGPLSTQPITLLPEPEPPELCWITSFRSQIVGEDGETPMSPEFMCHINLDYKPLEHGKKVGWKNKNPSARLFTLSQGAFLLEFPQGFGIPMMSNEPLRLVTQVLNHNFTDNPHFKVKHKVTIEFTRDKDLKIPLTPLFSIPAFQMRLLEGKNGYWNIENPDASKHGESCLPGINAPQAIRDSYYTDRFGRKFSGHWVVETKGPEVNAFNVTKLMNLTTDTKLHYANIHLHPFAESLELKDVTANRTVFKAIAKNPKERIGLTQVDSFASTEGVPLYKNHEYELISVYNNTSGSIQDAMATMFLYVFDPEFKKPSPEILASINPQNTPVKKHKPRNRHGRGSDRR